MDPVVVAFCTALISAMATDAWQQARSAVAAVVRRRRPTEPAECVGLELDDLRQRVLSAREQGRADIEQALTEVWQSRLQELLLEDPRLTMELQRILADILAPSLAPVDRLRAGQITMSGKSYGNSVFNQFAGNQYNARP